MKPYLFWLVIVLLTPTVSRAQAPRVRFDVPQTVAVRDVTSREFAFVNPHERLIEARVPISLLLERGSASDVLQLVHRLESTTAGAQAVDYAPKTTLATTIVGTTRVERQQQRDAKATLDVGATYYGLAKGQAHAEYAHRQQEEAAFEQLPSLELLTASGTVDRGRGVYFKLRPSPRTTLEGAHDYCIVLRVPHAWRSGLLYISSEAQGAERSVLGVGEEASVIGRGRFVVALYQQGDVVAQQAAQRYANAEANLRRTAAQHRHSLQRRTYPTPLHKLGVTRDNALARDWQDSVIFRGAADVALLEQLPTDVRLAVEMLLKTRQDLVSLQHAPTLAAAEGT